MSISLQDQAALAEAARDSTGDEHEERPSPEPQRTRGTLEVVPRAKRRTFSAEYKARILREAAAAARVGELGKLLRKEGLYSSHLAEWRALAKKGAQAELGKKRGPKPKHDATSRENDDLRRRVARLEEKLRKAEIIIDVQKKLATLLGIPIPTPPEDEQ